MESASREPALRTTVSRFGVDHAILPAECVSYGSKLLNKRFNIEKSTLYYEILFISNKQKIEEAGRLGLDLTAKLESPLNVGLREFLVPSNHVTPVTDLLHDSTEGSC